MARSFNGTSDFMESGVALTLTGISTITVAFWGWNNTNGSTDGLFAEYSNNFNNNSGSFLIDPNSGSFPGTFEFAFGTGGVGSNSDVTFPQASAGVWHQYTLVIDASVTSTANFAAYVDGTSQSLTSRSSIPATHNFGNYFVVLGSRNGTSLFNACRMAEFAVWNTTLTAANATSLANGARADSIALSNLVAYTPICGVASPEPDKILSTGWSVTGTTQVTNPVVGGCGNPVDEDFWPNYPLQQAEPIISVW